MPLFEADPVIMHPARPSEARVGGVHSYFRVNSNLYAHTRSKKMPLFEADPVTIA